MTLLGDYQWSAIALSLMQDAGHAREIPHTSKMGLSIGARKAEKNKKELKASSVTWTV